MTTNLNELNKILTEREMQVYLYAYHTNLDNYQIARKMHISIYEVLEELNMIKFKANSLRTPAINNVYECEETYERITL